MELQEDVQIRVRHAISILIMLPRAVKTILGRL
jgi:hypothetical protein